MSEDDDAALVFGEREEPTDPTGEFALSDRDVTPVLTDPCPECGTRNLVRIADWIHQPKTREECWHYWGKDCVRTQSDGDGWSFCPVSGYFTGHVRVHWPERRRAMTPLKEWGGPDRRKG